MFAYIKGELAHLEATHAVIEAQGVGYFLKVSLNTYGLLQAQPDKKSVVLHTYLQVQENAHNLYGFYELSERNVFLDLINVSGIGCNTAIVMLSSLSASELQQAIAQEDIKMIQSIKGIGAKTAQRVVLELKDKFQKQILTAGQPLIKAGSPGYSVKEEALTALMVLGLPKSTAEKNLEAVIKLKGNQVSLEELIKWSLKM